ncbi:hypothetical protein P1J78_05760 [Psychromarinibacter sp. C21-152]|uniref:Uncharacterized protein n=1 Tax=Psychromarinibacter sediminicola TaxID=3033385 RepID=A0AAE3T7E6_9RHOB|nr:hypothetical protein [Psychromarinibacter sediminicola]MDF0600230.1 hypothetical protein [Psychromarinibacter sediminicola]
MRHAIAMFALTAAPALAHPGHGVEGPAHWALSPLHGLGLVGVAVVLWALRARRKE